MRAVHVGASATILIVWAFWAGGTGYRDNSLRERGSFAGAAQVFTR